MEKSLGVDVEFKSETTVKRRFEGVTDTEWINGFVHLAIQTSPAEYDEEGKMTKRKGLTTVASYNQDVIYSVIDYYE